MANELERLRAIGLDPNFSDPQVYGPPRPTGQSGQLSTLDMLRKRMASELENEQSQRISDLGNALLMSRSPSLLGALGEGFRAQDEGTRARMDRLRQLAETERQERSLEGQEAGRRAEEAYRQESLRLRREEAARANRPRFTELTDAQGNVVFMDPETGRRVATDLRPARGQPRPLSEADRAGLRNRAETLANARVGIMQGVQPTAAQLEQARTLADDLYRGMLEAAGALPSPAPGTGQTGGATTPAPSQVLQYGGPRIAPRQP